jgi:hypothetical protein
VFFVLLPEKDSASINQNGTAVPEFPPKAKSSQYSYGIML